MTSRASVFLTLSWLALLVGGCVDTSEAEPDDEGDSTGIPDGQDSTQAPIDFSCGTLAPAERVVLGYVPTWSRFDEVVAGLDYDTLTHVAIAFANPKGDNGELVFEVEDSQIEALVGRAHGKGVKVIVSIAGASDSALVNEAIAPEKVEAFIADTVGFVERHNLDGVDVDIEGNAIDSRYEPFVTGLAAELRPLGKLVTAAVAKSTADGISRRAMWCFDFVNVMSYDYAGMWGAAGEHSTLSHARADLNYWVDRDYPASRTVLGMPFYGYCWGDGCARGYTPYSSIASQYPDQMEQDWISEEGIDISFNGTATITKKAQLAQDYGGVMVWEMSQDTGEKTLWNALKAGLTASDD